MELKLDELNIANVSQYRYLEHGFQISFEIVGCRYVLNVEEQKDGLFHPIDIYHTAEESNCQLCENTHSECTMLMNHKQKLFHWLIEHPAIRLEWLYINHTR